MPITDNPHTYTQLVTYKMDIYVWVTDRCRFQRYRPLHSMQYRQKEYLQVYKENDAFTDETNELYYGGIPMAFTCAGITVRDNELAEKYGYVRPELI